MWILFAFLSAFFAGITSILAKIGIQDTDSDLATTLRTGVVLIFSWLMVFLTGNISGFAALTWKNLLFLILSGLATGASWLCYFKALQLGDINKVVPIDKSSVILTMLLAWIFLGETLYWNGILGLLLIAAGTLLMIQKKKNTHSTENKSYFLWAILSAIFAAATSILGKLGTQDIPSNLATALRTCVVLIMAWLLVFLQKKQTQLPSISKKSIWFIILSGIATGLSWLCYYHALQNGKASIVAPIDKLSILFSILFARIWLGERLSKKALLGLGILTAGTLLLLVKF